MDADLTFRLALALAIGMVIGIERGWRERKAEPGSRTAGIRTYTLMGLLGGVFGALGTATSVPLLIGLGFAGFIAVFAWFKRAEADHDQDFSVTGTVAAMLVYGLGAFAVVGDMQLAAGAGIVTAAVLASREHLHGLITKITWPELRSALLLLGMTTIVLPLLPDRTLDPLDAINPREIWLFTIMVAGLSYAGYVAMRLLGPAKGVIVTGLTGGLVSSTAVTVAFARRAAEGEDARTLAAGATTAGGVSLVRVLAIAAAIQPALVPYIAPPILAAAAVFLVPALVAILWHKTDGKGETSLGNPFEILPALGFAALLAGVWLAAAWVNQRFGSAGLYPVAAVSGLADVDAISVSTARLAGKSVDLNTAATAILIALAANAIARAVYAALLEHGPLALRVAAVTLAALAAGALAAFVVRMLMV